MKLASTVLALVVALCANVALADTPTAINYQGLLTDGSGNAVADGSYSVTFTIYDAAAAGNSKWSETQSVTTADGLFAALLGSIAACSDVRFKTDISYLQNSLEKVMRLRGVNYRWRRDEFPQRDFEEGNQIGFIAQELESLFPEMVMTDSEGYKSVDYGRLTPVMVEAIKELKSKNDPIITELREIKLLLKGNIPEQTRADR